MTRVSPYDSQLKVDIEKLKQAPLHVELRHQCRVFDLVDDQYEFIDPVEGELTFTYVRGDVFVRGHMRVMTRTECVASLQEFDHLCEADVELVFVSEEKLATHRENEDDPELHMIHSFQGDVLHPAEALRECLMVELPVFPRSPQCADDLIQKYGTAGPADLTGASGDDSSKPPSDDAKGGGKDGSEEWKNRLRDLMNLPDIS